MWFGYLKTIKIGQLKLPYNGQLFRLKFLYGATEVNVFHVEINLAYKLVCKACTWCGESQTAGYSIFALLLILFWLFCDYS